MTPLAHGAAHMSLLVPMTMSIGLAAAVSPLLAGWTVALATPQCRRWWVPRRIRFRQWAPVALVAVILAMAAGLCRPWPAWWLFAAGGAVLMLVDLRTHLLPARLVYPLAAAAALTLLAVALIEQDFDRLARTLSAAAVAGACWFACVFAVPHGLHLGDVRVAALGAGLLGWNGWRQVVDGQLAIWLLALPLAGILVLAQRTRPNWQMAVPLGPALILGPLLVGAW